jgi:predicted lipoprotein with Yx(FWY)xxD motif
MQKKLLIGIIALIIVGGGAYALLHKAPAATDNVSTSQTSSIPKATPTATPTGSTSVISTKTDATLGSYLADSNGAALYTYGADTTGVSNCSGSCLYSWPIYDASSAPSSLPTNVTVITRSDGSKQYAYKGMPLYTFTADSSGQVTGDGVSNFHVAKP